MEPSLIESSLMEAVRSIFPEIGASVLNVQMEKVISDPSEFIVTTGITGDMKGILMIKALCIDAVEIANIMLGNIGQAGDRSGITQSHKEALGEIANLVSGRFLNILSVNSVDYCTCVHYIVCINKTA